MSGRRASWRSGRAIERQQAEIERLERFVTRFRAGTRARQAQSRAKKLSRMERLTRDPKDGAALEFAFKPPERSGRVVFELEHGSIEIGSKQLLDDAELWLERGEHVSLVGPNGAGKTTLIETLAGRRELGGGKLRTGHNVKVGYLSQHAEELSAGTARTVLEATTHLTGLTPNKARALLGRFMFSGEDAEKPLDGLSGGERRRLSLAVLVHSGANVLILDEPTNHLDLESREALEHALGEFQGSLLLVSHDRALLDAVGTPDDRVRGPDAAQLRRRLAGVRAGAGGAQGATARGGDGEAGEVGAAKPGGGEAREGGEAARRPAKSASAPKSAKPKPKRPPRPAPRSSSSVRSRPPRPSCARSRTSSPSRPPGRPRRRRLTRPPATRRPSGRSSSCTSAGRRSPG